MILTPCTCFVPQSVCPSFPSLDQLFSVAYLFAGRLSINWVRFNILKKFSFFLQNLYLSDRMVIYQNDERNKPKFDNRECPLVRGHTPLGDTFLSAHAKPAIYAESSVGRVVPLATRVWFGGA